MSSKTNSTPRRPLTQTHEINGAEHGAERPSIQATASARSPPNARCRGRPPDWPPCSPDRLEQQRRLDSRAPAAPTTTTQASTTTATTATTTTTTTATAPPSPYGRPATHARPRSAPHQMLGWRPSQARRMQIRPRHRSPPITPADRPGPVPRWRRGPPPQQVPAGRRRAGLFAAGERPARPRSANCKSDGPGRHHPLDNSQQPGGAETGFLCGLPVILCQLRSFRKPFLPSKSSCCPRRDGAPRLDGLSLLLQLQLHWQLLWLLAVAGRHATPTGRPIDGG
jgi:hypothetical protein